MAVAIEEGRNKAKKPADSSAKTSQEVSADKTEEQEAVAEAK